MEESLEAPDGSCESAGRRKSRPYATTVIDDYWSKIAADSGV